MKYEPKKGRFYREELLMELTGKSRRAVQAWFRRNEMDIQNAEHVSQYISRFQGRHSLSKTL